MNLTNKKELKILIIGDREVGKTSLSLKYFSNADRDKFEEAEPPANLNSTDESLGFPKQTNPTEQQKYTCMHTDLNKFQLSLLSASDQYVPTTLSVYKCDIKINFVDYGLSLTDTSGCRHNKKFVQLRQYYYTITKWYPEIRQYYKDVPILLIGTKSDIKHQIKLYRKMKQEEKLRELKLLSDSSYIEDNEHNVTATANTTFTSNDTLSASHLMNKKKYLNLLMDSMNNNNTKQQQTLLSNEFASIIKAIDVQLEETVKPQGKTCIYCASLERKKKAYTAGNCLNNLTKYQVETAKPSVKPRTVSIISKVSHQHIIDANNILFNKNNNDLNPETVTNASDLGVASGSISKNSGGLFKSFLSHFMNKPKQFAAAASIDKTSENTNSIQTIGQVSNKTTLNESVDYILNYQQSEDEEKDYDNLNVQDLDGLISNLKSELNFTEREIELTNRAFRNPLLSNDNFLNYSTSESNKLSTRSEVKNEETGGTCPFFNLCETCQQNLEPVENVAGIAAAQAETCTSVLVNKNTFGSNETLRQSKPEAEPQLATTDSPQTDETVGKQLNKMQLIKRRDCLKLRQAINAKKYMQCSTLDEYAVKNVMDTAIELALEFHLKKLKNKKLGGGSSTHQLVSPVDTLKTHMFDSSADSGNNDQSHNTTLNDSMTKTNQFGMYQAATPSRSKNKLTKKFSNSTEYSYVVEGESVLLNRDATDRIVEQEARDIEQNICGIESHDEQLKVNKNLVKVKNQGKKKARSLSRCLSCTRGNNNTSTSLDKL